MGLIKVFSGSEILATALKAKLEEVGIDVIMKNNNQSNIVLGSATTLAVELFIDESKYGRADEVITDFKVSIQ